MVKIFYQKSRDLFNELTDEEMIKRHLKRLRNYHPETHRHSLQVGLLSIDLGHGEGFEGADLRNLGYTGLLHDIGKLRIPLEILTKASRLSDDEMDIMRGHPRLGFLELEGLEYDTIRNIMVAHHEYKRDPYPRKGIDRRKEDRGQEDRRNVDGHISTLAQITAVCDIYDALASRRSYKEALGYEEIFKILSEQYTGDSRYVEEVMRRH